MAKAPDSRPAEWRACNNNSACSVVQFRGLPSTDDGGCMRNFKTHWKKNRTLPQGSSLAIQSTSESVHTKTRGRVIFPRVSIDSRNKLVNHQINTIWQEFFNPSNAEGLWTGHLASRWQRHGFLVHNAQSFECKTQVLALPKQWTRSGGIN